MNDVLADEQAYKELTSVIGTISNSRNAVTFSELLQTDETQLKSLQSTPHLRYIVQQAFSSKSQLKSEQAHIDTLIAFLTREDVLLYCPYPMDFYPADKQYPTITFHPITNTETNIGYRIEPQGVVECVVNEAYAEEYPVFIISPQSEITVMLENNENTNLLKATQATGHEAKLGYFSCSNYCGGIFEGDLEMKILRVHGTVVSADATNPQIRGVIGPYTISFDYARAKVRSNHKGWDHQWHNIQSIWDGNWTSDKIGQGIVIYEYDKKKETSFTVGYTLEFSTKGTKNGVEITSKQVMSQSLTQKIESDNDLLYSNEIPRGWYISKNKVDQGYRLKDGYAVYNFSEVKMSIPYSTYTY